MHAPNKLPSMHCNTALCTHIHTHLAMHALQHSTVHAHTHTPSYTCTATQHCARTHTHTSGYPCTRRKPHANTNTFSHSSMHTQTNWLHIHCRTGIIYASTYTHIWLSMHYKMTPCKHKHTQIHGYASTIQINIHALPHSTVHTHTHTTGYYSRRNSKMKHPKNGIRR